MCERLRWGRGDGEKTRFMSDSSSIQNGPTNDTDTAHPSASLHFEYYLIKPRDYAALLVLNP
jgi:hypothetical protein